MIEFIVSILLGAAPEVLFFTLFLVYAKNLKTKKLSLFIWLLITYIALIITVQFQLLFYGLYIVVGFFILKLLYKKQCYITDIFILFVAYFYLIITSLISYKLFGNNYIVAYTINRIMLFSIVFFKNKLNLSYNKYKSLWNKSNSLKIKSITLRNVSLIFGNILFILLNLFISMYSIDFLNSMK